MTHILLIRELVRALEGAAGNTDTDPRWQAATALRQMQSWEQAWLRVKLDELIGFIA